MKKTVKMLAASLLLVSAGTVMADAGNVYLGASFGQTKVSDWMPDADSSDDTDIGHKLFGGYQINNNFALELSFIDSGEATATFGSQKVKGNVSAITVDGLGKYDVAPWASLFGRLGAYTAHAELKSEGDSVDHDKFGLHFGLGADFTVAKNIVIRTEWERLRNVEVNDVEADVDMLSVGAFYRF